MFSHNISLNSRDSISNEKWLPKWSISLPQFNTLRSQYHLQLVNCQIPNRVYPVNEFYNTISFTENDVTTHTVTLTSNNYSGSTLAVHLQSVMNNASALAYTVSYDTDSKKLVIIPSSGVFKWNSNITNSAYEILGVTTFNVNSASYTSDVPIRLSGTNYIDIISSDFQTDSTSSTHNTNLVARIPMYHNFGGIIFYEPQLHHPMQVQNSTGMMNISLELRDDHGNPWKLDEYGYISLEFKVSGHNKHRV